MGRSGDGCSNVCEIECGYDCAANTPGVRPDDVCFHTCGDGIKANVEGCDDSNLAADDGCSESCSIEDGWYCDGKSLDVGKKVCESSDCYTKCGDGLNAGLELLPANCDDGNTLSGDGCNQICQVECGWYCDPGPPCTPYGNASRCHLKETCNTRCGDAIQAGAETCDDGNLESGDGCTDMCTREPYFSFEAGPCLETIATPICGDAHTVGYEMTDPARCEDGNLQSQDGCNSTCFTECGWTCTGGDAESPQTCATRCGDDLLAGIEFCDDGDIQSGNGCSSTCESWDPGFECVSTACAHSYCFPVCGDNYRVADELKPGRCEDGNSIQGDGCFNCAVECGYYCDGGGIGKVDVCHTHCGDGKFVAAHEGCDDGNNIDGDGCSALCLREPGWDCQNSACGASVCVSAGCGDNIWVNDGIEECDNGRNSGCMNCTVECGWYCSPSVYDYESFSDSLYDGQGYGKSQCWTHCGDNIKAGDEACDDGNSESGDGCYNCQIEFGWACDLVYLPGDIAGCERTPECHALCGDGTLIGPELLEGRCDDSNIDSMDGCDSECHLECGYFCPGGSGCAMPTSVCGDGILASDEQCDDGNPLSGDGCSSTCVVETSWLCTSTACGLSECEPDGCSCNSYSSACTSACDSETTCNGDGYCNEFGSCTCFYGFEFVVGQGCLPICGDNLVTGIETCDPPGPGCSDQCSILPGWTCQYHEASGSYCHSTCGDRVIARGFTGPGDTLGSSGGDSSDVFGDDYFYGEECDDGNTVDDDGCNSFCMIEQNWICEDVCKLDGRCTYECRVGVNDCGIAGISATVPCNNGHGCGDDGYCREDGSCQCFFGYAFSNSSAGCFPICGDNFITGFETCDPPGQGCTQSCTTQHGWECDVNGYCQHECGDGIVALGIGGEECDDGNTRSGDGCDQNCVLEPNWVCTDVCRKDVCECTGFCTDLLCTDNPLTTCAKECDSERDCGEGYCRPDGTCQCFVGYENDAETGYCRPICGDGIIARGDTPGSSEPCDDGNLVDGDGCSPECEIECGWYCPYVYGSNQPSACSMTCGDGIMAYGGIEECDDGNTHDGDGCSSNCIYESFEWSCINNVCNISTCEIRACTGCSNRGGVYSASVLRPDDCGKTCDAVIDCGGNGFCDFDGLCQCFNGYLPSDVTGSCESVCGDGIIAGSEICDDGNQAIGDGCSDQCTVETGWTCEQPNPLAASLCLPDMICDEFYAEARGDTGMFAAWKYLFDTADPPDLQVEINFNLLSGCPQSDSPPSESQITFVLSETDKWPTYASGYAAFTQGALASLDPFPGVYPGNQYTAQGRLRVAKGAGKTCSFNNVIVISSKPGIATEVAVSYDEELERTCITWTLPEDTGYGCSPAPEDLSSIVKMSVNSWLTTFSQTPVNPGVTTTCYDGLKSGKLHSWRIVSCNLGLCGCCGESSACPAASADGEEYNSCSISFRIPKVIKLDTVVPETIDYTTGGTVEIAVSNLFGISRSNFRATMTGDSSKNVFVASASKDVLNIPGDGLEAPDVVKVSFFAPAWAYGTETVTVHVNFTNIDPVQGNGKTYFDRIVFDLEYFDPDQNRLISFTPTSGLTTGGSLVYVRIANSGVTSPAFLALILQTPSISTCETCIEKVQTVDFGVVGISLRLPPVPEPGIVRLNVLRKGTITVVPHFDFLIEEPCDYENVFCPSLGDSFRVDTEAVRINPPATGTCLSRYCLNYALIPSPDLIDFAPKVAPSVGNLTLSVTLNNLKVSLLSQVRGTFGAQPAVVRSFKNVPASTKTVIELYVPSLSASVCPTCPSLNDGCGINKVCSIDITLFSTVFPERIVKLPFSYNFYPKFPPEIKSLSMGCQLDRPSVCDNNERIIPVGTTKRIIVEIIDFPFVELADMKLVRMVWNGTDTAATILSSALTGTKIAIEFYGAKAATWPITIYHRNDPSFHKVHFMFKVAKLEPKFSMATPNTFKAQSASSMRVSYTRLPLSASSAPVISLSCGANNVLLQIAEPIERQNDVTTISVSLPRLAACIWDIILTVNGTSTTESGALTVFDGMKVTSTFPLSGKVGTVVEIVVTNVGARTANNFKVQFGDGNGPTTIVDCTLGYISNGDIQVKAQVPSTLSPRRYKSKVLSDNSAIPGSEFDFIVSAPSAVIASPSKVPLLSPYQIILTVPNFDSSSIGLSKVDIDYLQQLVPIDKWLRTATSPDTIIRITLPEQSFAGASSGRISFSKLIGNTPDWAASVPFTVDRFSPPMITSLSPSRGDIAGGDTVEVSLSGFSIVSEGQVRVTFGGVSARILEVIGENKVLCLTPKQSIGGKVVVKAEPTVVGSEAEKQRRTATSSFDYFKPNAQVLSLTPSRGVIEGGSGIVTVIGRNFPTVFSTDALSCTFGDPDRVGFVIEVLYSDAGAIAFTLQAPAGPIGKVEFSVVASSNTGGTVTAVAPFEFYDKRLVTTCRIPLAEVTWEWTIGTCVGHLTDPAPDGCGVDISGLEISVYEQFSNCPMRPQDCGYPVDTAFAGFNTGESGFNMWRTSSENALKMRGGEYAATIKLPGYIPFVYYFGVSNAAVTRQATLSPVLGSRQQRVVLRWPNSYILPDVDLYVIPTITEYYFNEPTYCWKNQPVVPQTPVPFAPTFTVVLDRDDALHEYHPGTHGSETATITDAPSGDYQVWVHAFPSEEPGAENYFTREIYDLIGPMWAEVYCDNCFDSNGEQKQGWVTTIKQEGSTDVDTERPYEWWMIGTFFNDGDSYTFRECNDRCYRLGRSSAGDDPTASANPPYALITGGLGVPLEDGYPPPQLRRGAANVSVVNLFSNVSSWEPKQSSEFVRRQAARRKLQMMSQRPVRHSLPLGSIDNATNAYNGGLARMEEKYGNRKLLQSSDESYSEMCGGRASGGELIELSMTNLPPIKAVTDLTSLIDQKPMDVRGILPPPNPNMQRVSVIVPALTTRVEDASGRTVVDLQATYSAYSSEQSDSYSFDAVLDFNYISDPAATLARFDNYAQGSALTMTLNTATNRASTKGGSFPCSRFFDDYSAGLLGRDSRCFWSSTSTLNALLGPGALLSPGHIISLKPFILRSENRISAYSEFVSSVVSAPQATTRPTFTIVGPSSIGECDSAVIQAVYSASRPLTFQWWCSDCGGEDSNLNTTLSYIAGSRFTLSPMDLPQSDHVYKLHARATNFLGTSSLQMTFFVARTKQFIPLITMSSGASEVDRQQSIYISGNIAFSKCGGGKQEVSFEWTQTRPANAAGNNRIPARYLSVSGPVLIIPGSVLSAGHYEVALKASLPGLSPPQTVVSPVAFSVLPSKLQAEIAGGSRTLSTDSVITLDARASRDPDSATAILSYSWTCLRDMSLPCIDRTTNLVLRFQSSAVQTLPAKTLPAGNYRFSLMLSQGMRAVKTHVDVKLVAEFVPSVTISYQGGIKHGGLTYVNVGEGEDLILTADRLNGGTYEWTASDEGLSSYISAFSTRKIFIPASAVTLGRTYTLSLRASMPAAPQQVCANSVCVGGASISVTFNRPPYGAECAASPTTGVELTDLFTISCEGWADDQAPIMYKYGATVNGVDVYFGRTYDTSMSIYLSAGTAYPIVLATDALGGSTVFRNINNISITSAPLDTDFVADQALAMTQLSKFSEFSNFAFAIGGKLDELGGTSGGRRALESVTTELMTSLESLVTKMPTTRDGIFTSIATLSSLTKTFNPRTASAKSASLLKTLVQSLGEFSSDLVMTASQAQNIIMIADTTVTAFETSGYDDNTQQNQVSPKSTSPPANFSMLYQKHPHMHACLKQQREHIPDPAFSAQVITDLGTSVRSSMTEVSKGLAPDAASATVCPTGTCTSTGSIFATRVLSKDKMAASHSAAGEGMVSIVLPASIATEVAALSAAEVVTLHTFRWASVWANGTLAQAGLKPVSYMHSVALQADYANVDISARRSAVAENITSKRALLGDRITVSVPLNEDVETLRKLWTCGTWSGTSWVTSGCAPVSTQV